MITKIIRMVSQFGEINIESLMSWFPQSEKNQIIEQINASNELSLIGDIVSLKKNLEINELDITKETVTAIIDKYNSKINFEYENLRLNHEDNKLNIIISFLERRYTLEKFIDEDDLHIYISLEKGNSINKRYVVITSIINDKIYEMLDSMFNDETVFIYYIDKNEYGECKTTKDFYIKSCEAILNEYAVTYRLKFETAKIATIETKIGGENIE